MTVMKAMLPVVVMLAFMLLAAAGSPDLLHVGPGRDIDTLDEALRRAAARDPPSSAPLTVHLHGTVTMPGMPLVIGPEHSYLTIVGGAISGGVRIAGAAWKKFAGADSVWTAATTAGLPSARQLYVDGIRANRTMV